MWQREFTGRHIFELPAATSQPTHQSQGRDIYHIVSVLTADVWQPARKWSDGLAVETQKDCVIPGRVHHFAMALNRDGTLVGPMPTTLSQYGV